MNSCLCVIRKNAVTNDFFYHIQAEDGNIFFISRPLYLYQAKFSTGQCIKSRYLSTGKKTTVLHIDSTKNMN